jgi:hypothetical protein
MRPHPFAATALTAALLLTACGPGGGTDSADAPATDRPVATTTGTSSARTTAGPTEATAATSGPFAGQTPRQILAASRTAALAASSVHVKGAITSDGQTTKLDLILSSDGSADGRIGMGGDELSVRQVGTTTYILAGAGFWAGQGLGPASTAVSGKWFRVPPNAPGFSQFSTLTNMKALFSELLDDQSTTTLTQVPGKASRGQRTIGLLDSGEDGGTLYVAASEARPVPLALIPLPGEAATGDRLLFYDWDNPVTIADPPAREIVEVSQLSSLS